MEKIEDIRDTTTPADHLPLIKFFLSKYISKHPWTTHLHDDLLSIGYLETVNCWEVYDPSRGKLSTFLGARLEGAFDRSVEKQLDPISLPCHYRYRYGKRPFFFRNLTRCKITVNSEAQRNIDRMDLCKHLQKALLSLDEKNRNFIKLSLGLFGEERKTVQQIASENGISRQAVDRRIRRSIEKIREATKEEKFSELKEFWEEA